MRINFLVRDLYSESTLDAAIGRLTQSEAANQDISSILRQFGVDKRVLMRTVKKGVEEYVDGLVALRHGWKPKMMDGTPEEKSEVYNGLHDTVKKMDDFSEPYVSAMRLLSAVALRQLATIAAPRTQQTIEEALRYEGERYNFDEQNVLVTVKTGLMLPKKEGRKPASVAEAYDSIATEFMHLKDVLNLMEDATTPEVYENVRNTNEFPEARIGKCFEVTHKIDRTLRQIEQGYEFLLNRGELPQGDRRRIMQETLGLLRSLDRGWITRSTQWYAALQFNEKPWNTLYWLSILATGAGVVSTVYSYTSDPKQIGLFFASDGWTICSGVAIYLFTDAGPKTAKWLRKLDDIIVRYNRV